MPNHLKQVYEPTLDGRSI